MDHILYWNSVALEANRRDFSNEPGKETPAPEQGGPTLSSRALAIVHLAMYDAHAGVVGGAGLPRYLSAPTSPPPGANAAAAVAAAAHTCLSALFPRQKGHFDAALSAASLSGVGVAEGHAFGLLVAKAILVDRGGDPSASATGYCLSNSPGYHRLDPANPEQPVHAPFYGAGSKGFAVTTRHTLLKPPALNSSEYQRALRQVRSKGIAQELMGALPDTYSNPSEPVQKRTADETLVGLYWAYDGVRNLGTPPRLYNLIVREVAMNTINPATGAVNDVDQNARLFAFVNAALGDAGILAWDQKYIHDLWRPVVGIREQDGAMGPAAPTPNSTLSNDCDPGWLPLGAPQSNGPERNFTPPFPAYPSGHATFGAAAFQITRLFYGVAIGNRSHDTLFLGSFVSEELNGTTRDNSGTVRPRHARSFSRGLWQMIEENGFSRVWLGVHWFFDAFALDPAGQPDLTQDIGGVPLGLKIAEDIFSAGAGLGPVKSPVVPRH